MLTQITYSTTGNQASDKTFPLGLRLLELRIKLDEGLNNKKYLDYSSQIFKKL